MPRARQDAGNWPNGRGRPVRSVTCRSAGPDLRRGLGPRADAELAEGVLEVLVDRADADRQAVGDLLVGVALGDEPDDLRLAWRQAGGREPPLDRLGAALVGARAQRGQR